MENSSSLEPAPRVARQLTLLIQGTCPCHPECGVVGQFRAPLTHPDIPLAEHWQLL